MTRRDFAKTLAPLVGAVAIAADAGDGRTQLYAQLGSLPPRDGKIGVQKLFSRVQNGYAVESLLLDLGGGDPLPAYFVKPGQTLHGKLPALLYCASQAGDGELIDGAERLLKPAYAGFLTGMDYAALCIGQPERAPWGMAVYNSLRAVGYLGGRSDVEAARLGALGFGRGGAMARWVAALEERIKVCVDICGLADSPEPSVLPDGLIVPRAHLALEGKQGPATPPDLLDRAEREMKKAYSGHGGRWKLARYDGGAVETEGMRKEIAKFLGKNL